MSNLPIINKGHVNIDNEKFNLFYPTSSIVYKNYIVTLKAIAIIKKIRPDIYKKLIFNITLSSDDKTISKFIVDNKIEGKVNLLSNIEYTDVLSYYKKSDLLVFTSFIETLGLPLIEGASFGIPILVSDLDYSRELLSEYEGATYIKYDSPNEWANSIIQVFEEKKRYMPLKIRQVESSWRTFIKLIQTK